jgi:hypothetical protein
MEAGQRRRGLVDLADNDTIAPLDFVVRYSLDVGRWNIHHDVALGENEIHADQALDRGFELLYARRDGNVQRAQRVRVDAAGRIESVAELEPPHCISDSFVVDVAGFLLGRQVVADDKAPAQ